MGAPCSWTVDQCPCSTACWTKYKPATRERASALAVHWMWAATGRRYGLCEVTVLPCSPAPAEPLYQDYSLVAGPGAGLDIVDGQWHNAPCSGGCSCTSRCEVDLPGPVDSIVEVLIDGEPLDPDAYRVYDRRSLARIDGGCWPTCQVFGTEIPGFQVTEMLGDPVPDHVQYATEALACQLARGCEGGADCALPPRMRTLTRQGVTLEVATEESASIGGKLRTGIKEVDDVVTADNPYGLTQAPRVLSPDLPTVRVATWGGGS